LLNSFPTIQFQDVKVTKFNRNKVEGDFLLRITLTDKDQINDLLSRIFSETASYSKRIKNQNLGRFFISKNSSASYNFFIPGSFFSDANELFSVKIKNTDLKQVKVFTSIIFYNIPQNINMQNLIAYLSFIH